MSATARYPLIAGLAFFIGLNLRPMLAAIGPLMDVLQAELGLSSAQASLLTTLPLVLMGVCALTGPWLQRLVGEVRGIALGMGLIAAANLARFVIDSGSFLILSAAVAGAGIAMVQALMPAWLKRHHPERAGALMGLFTSGIMGGAVLAAAGAAPVAAIGGWQTVLGLAGIPALLALLAWLRYAGRDHGCGTRVSLPWRNAQAWSLLAYFGVGTSAYTLVLAWLSPYYVDLGLSRAQAGYLLGGISLMEVVAGLAVASFIHRFPDRRPLLTVIILLILSGLLGLILAPVPLKWPIVIVLGLGIGALFPLQLIVTLDHADTAVRAGALLAFVQGGGYTIAALMPLLAGFIRDSLASLTLAWLGMGLGTLLLLAMTWTMRRAGHGEKAAA